MSCEYCDEEADIPFAYAEERFMGAYAAVDRTIVIRDDEIVHRSWLKVSDDCDEARLRIRYCPMCGEFLGDDGNVSC